MPLNSASSAPKTTQFQPFTRFSALTVQIIAFAPSISFIRIIVKEVTFVDGDGKVQYYDGSILEFEVKLCTDLTVNIVYEPATIEIEVAEELTIAYTGENTSGVDPEIIDNGAESTPERISTKTTITIYLSYCKKV